MRSANTYVFSEKDMPGYKRREYGRGPQSDDEGEVRGRSYLYEKQKREARKKEARRRNEPYVRKTIPSRCLSGLEVDFC